MKYRVWAKGYGVYNKGNRLTKNYGSWFSYQNVLETTVKGRALAEYKRLPNPKSLTVIK